MRIPLTVASVLLVGLVFVFSRHPPGALAQPPATLDEEAQCILYLGNQACCTSENPDCDCSNLTQRWCTRTSKLESTATCDSATLKACFSIPMYTSVEEGEYYINTLALCYISAPCTNEAGGSLCYDVCIYQPLIPCGFYILSYNWVPIVLGVGGDCPTGDPPDT